MSNANVSYEKERMFAEKLANVFLLDNKIQVAQGSNNIAYCYVALKKIYLNFPEIFQGAMEGLFKDMMTFKGLLLHEILHLKFTTNSKRAKRLNPQILSLLGRLEDGRIETLGVMQTEKLADYLIFAVNNVLLKNRDKILANKKDELINTYILCFGRSIYFQDKDLLVKMRELIIKIYGREVAEFIELCITQYIPERSSEKRIKIAEKLFYFLNNKNVYPDYDEGQLGNAMWIITTEGDQKMTPEMKELSKDFPQLNKVFIKLVDELKEETKDVKDSTKEREEFEEKKEKELDELRQKRRKAFEEMYDEDDNDKQEQKKKEIEKLQDDMDNVASQSFVPDDLDDLDDLDDDDEDTDDLDDLDDLDDDDEDTDDDDDDEDTDDDDDEDTDDDDEDTDDDDDEDTDIKQPISLKTMLDNKITEQDGLIDKNENDLTTDLKSLGHPIDVSSDTSFEITDDMKMLSNSLQNGLKKMNNDLKKGYVQKQKAGRVNVRRFLNRSSIQDTKVFNKWLPDKMKQTKILVNLFVDGSGSMTKHWKTAINSCWILNEALNKDENKIMAYQFSTSFKQFKKYDEPLVVPTILSGATDPYYAIQDAIPIIESYKKGKGYKYVVDIIITDGIFDNATRNDEIIETLNKLGHETIIIHIGNFSYLTKENIEEKYRHNAKHYMMLSDFNVLVSETIKIFTKIKKNLIMKAKGL